MPKLTTQVGEAKPTNGLEAQIKKIVEEIAEKAKASITAARTRIKQTTKRKAPKRTKIKGNSGKLSSVGAGFKLAATLTLTAAMLAGCGPTDTQEATTTTPPTKPGYEQKVDQSDNKGNESKDSTSPAVTTSPELDDSNDWGDGNNGFEDEPAGDNGLDDITAQPQQPDNSPSPSSSQGAQPVGELDLSNEALFQLYENYSTQLIVRIGDLCGMMGCSDEQRVQCVEAAIEQFKANLLGVQKLGAQPTTFWEKAAKDASDAVHPISK